MHYPVSSTPLYKFNDFQCFTYKSALSILFYKTVLYKVSMIDLKRKVKQREATEFASGALATRLCYKQRYRKSKRVCLRLRVERNKSSYMFDLYRPRESQAVDILLNKDKDDAKVYEFRSQAVDVLLKQSLLRHSINVQSLGVFLIALLLYFTLLYSI